MGEGAKRTRGTGEVSGEEGALNVVGGGAGDGRRRLPFGEEFLAVREGFEPSIRVYPV